MVSTYCTKFNNFFSILYRIDDFNLYCFEIKTSTNTYVYGNQTPEHRTKWLNNIAECLNDNLNNPEFCYQRIGWSYIKEGIFKKHFFGKS